MIEYTFQNSSNYTLKKELILLRLSYISIAVIKNKTKLVNHTKTST